MHAHICYRYLLLNELRKLSVLRDLDFRQDFADTQSAVPQSLKETGFL